MLLITRRISTAAQHYRFQLIPIGADVASLSRPAASFLCKLKLLEQVRETWKLGNGWRCSRNSSQVIYSMMYYPPLFILK